MRDDERAANGPGAAAGCAGAAVFPQYDAQVSAGDMHRRHGADDHAERTRQGENADDDDRIHPDLFSARNVGEAKRRQGAETPGAKDQAERSSEDGQDHRLGHQLADDASPGRAEGVTRGDLLQAAGRPGQGEIRDVHRRDEEQADNAAPEHHECRTHVAHEIRRQRTDLRAVAGVDENRLHRPRTLDNRRVHRVDPRTHLGQRDAWSQPGDLIVVLAVAAILRPLLRGERERHPEPHIGIQERERLWHHAHDRIAVVVEHQIAADDAVHATGLPRREGPAENGDAVATGRAFVLGKPPAAGGRNFQHVEE